MKKTRSKKKAAMIVFLSVIVFLLIGWWAFCVMMYNENINVRGDSYEPLKLRTEDFDSLECKEYSFSSDKGQKLAGYLYSVGSDQHGIVVIAHGFGGGHNSYMDAAYFFAENGYYVFAYDATGCDKINARCQFEALVFIKFLYSLYPASLDGWRCDNKNLFRTA